MIKTYKNAICLPCIGCENKALFPNAKGGVFDQDRQPIKHGFLAREYRQDVKFINGRWDRSSGLAIKHHALILPGKIEGSQKKLAGKYIFAGYLFPHYGHFLLESLANLWFIKRHPKLPIIWLGVHNQQSLNTVNIQFMELYGLKNPVHILTEQTEIEKLVIPEPGYRIHTRYTPEQVRALQVLKPVKPVKGKKIWLSRSQLPGGGIDNEYLLEPFLEKSGWTIYHPQNHKIKDQLHMLNDAEQIAGIEGSALHTIMMIPQFKGKIHIFSRRPRIEFDFVFIAETLGLAQDIHYPACIRWSHDLPHWDYNRFWLRLDPILTALGVTRSPKTAEPPHGNLQKVLTGITHHFDLKLMVEFWSKNTVAGDVGNHCKTVLASTSISFDTKHLPKNVDHLDISADQFFTSELLPKAPDIYCFRHNSDEQTLVRAFNSSVVVSKPKTLWVIEYHANERALEVKNKTDIDSRNVSSNHKLLQYIADCCPMFTVRRLRGSNIAVVWQQPKHMHRPALADFASFNDHIDFNRCPVQTLEEIAVEIKKWSAK